VTPRLIPPEDLEGEGLRGPFHGAMTTPVGFALNPLKYTLGLARAARAAGAAIHGHTPVTGIRSDTGFTLSTPRGRIRARRLVVATNGYSADDLPPWLRARYLPVQSNVIVTRPLTGAEIAEQGWSSRQMCYDARFLLHYFRLMPDGRMLFGMRGGLGSSPRADARMHRRIRAHFEAMFPAWAHVETPWSWNGLLSIAPDLTPFAGPVPEMPGAYAALSYHGNGVAMGTYAGALLADLVQGRVPQRLYPQVMQAPPRRFRLGRLRRATLWPLYAYAAVTGG
jgi:glycine/D-amino acid oxidase-like deaminating enzyme